MHLQAIASAFPEPVFTQEEVWSMLRGAPGARRLKTRSMELLGKVLCGAGGIETRHFAEEDPSRLFGLDPGGLNAYYERACPALGARALQAVLDKAGVPAEALDALVVCSCTGYLCPGPGSYIAGELGLREDCWLTDLVGHGCGAALPALRAADMHLARHPGDLVAVVAVEICSAAFFLHDDPAALISLCLFADGANASLWSGADSALGMGKLGGFRSLHRPQHRNKLRFSNDGGYLRNHLDRSVPALAADAVASLLPPDSVDGPLVCHPGGRDVLSAIQGLQPGRDMRASREVLRTRGNCSSPGVMMALEEDLRRPAAHAASDLLSFGAGFSCHHARFHRA